MAGELSIVMTEDGSPTVWDADARAHFHSMGGARSESEHVYINASSIPARLQQGGTVSVLEVGLGTGLNFMLTAQLALAHPAATLQYRAFDKRLLPADLLKQYYSHFDFDAGLLQLLLNPPGGAYRNVHLSVHNQPWQPDQLPADTLFDVVYYDAFAPNAEPLLWQEDAFAGALHRRRAGGVLVTYSVTGNIKRLLRKLGLKSERPKGFGPKREMLVVYK
jgi:tRNA U34 5-methylaminomethyl-2-thiouridine-forming methyltransferase MnmC